MTCIVSKPMTTSTTTTQLIWLLSSTTPTSTMLRPTLSVDNYTRCIHASASIQHDSAPQDGLQPLCRVILDYVSTRPIRRQLYPTFPVGRLCAAYWPRILSSMTSAPQDYLRPLCHAISKPSRLPLTFHMSLYHMYNDRRL